MEIGLSENPDDVVESHHDTKEEAQKWADKYNEEEGFNKKLDKPLHTLPFTPELKDSVLYNGQPMFKTKGGDLPGVLPPKDAGENNLTKDQVQTAFPGAKITESNAMRGLYEGFQVDLPNGKRIIVRKNEFIMVDSKNLEAGYGQKELGPGEYIAGEAKRIDRGAMITLAKGEGVGTFSHETFHVAMDMVLTDREKAAVLKQYGDEEAAARAFETWDPQAQPDTFFGKIVDFFRQAYRALFPDADTVFGKVKEGGVLGPGGEGTGRLRGVRKLRVRDEEGEWGMESGLRGRVVGNVAAAKEQYKGVKNWFLTRFASDSTSKEALATKQVISGTQAASRVEKIRMKKILDALQRTDGQNCRP